MRRSNTRPAESAAALATLNRLQESFAHGVSHDLRAPLRAIDSFSALLSSHLDGGLDETARDYLERIRGATARMGALIDALLELSRVDARGTAPGAGRSRPAGRLGLRRTAPMPNPGAAPTSSCSPACRSLGDERLLRQLMNQLLHNAWKFSRDRDRVRIEVSGERRGDRVVIAVRDHGSGFDMRYADKLFEPFQRLHGPEQAAATASAWRSCAASSSAMAAVHGRSRNPGPAAPSSSNCPPSRRPTNQA